MPFDESESFLDPAFPGRARTDNVSSFVASDMSKKLVSPHTAAAQAESTTRGRLDRARLRRKTRRDEDCLPLKYTSGRYCDISEKRDDGLVHPYTKSSRALKVKEVTSASFHFDDYS